MEIAILFVVFNRPEVTKKVFDAIRVLQPSRLYIVADGPRMSVAGDEELSNKTRKIANNVDWDCTVETLFRERNLGCRVAVSTAIDWFFENEEMGVILEDDCLPDQTFFRYCSELLERFKNDTRVMSISGDYFHGEKEMPSESYYFSRYHHCWGWASWRRAWVHYDRNMDAWRELHNSNWLLSIGDNHSDFAQYWNRIFNKSFEGKIDS